MLTTFDHEVRCWNPTGGRIQLMTIGGFVARSLSLSPFRHLNMLVTVAQLDAHPTGDQEVAGLIPIWLATFCHGD